MHIGLATWKLDRFVSVDSSVNGGTLTTIPIKFSGKRLEINAETSGSGLVTVELLDPAGNPIEGIHESDPFHGDDLRHTVTFGGSSDLSRVQGQTVRLRLHLVDAELYSFRFRQ